jgi:hypothetical protein
MELRCSSGSPALNRLFSEIPTLSLAKERDPYHLKDLGGKILPLRVTFRKQRDLLFPSPSLDLLLTLSGYLGIAISFKVHQPVNFVLPGKTIEQAGLVLYHPLAQIVGKTDV